MNRKRTIMTAALVNAGLLLVLFIAALTTPEEVVEMPIVQAPVLAEEEGKIASATPLFKESADEALRQALQEKAPAVEVAAKEETPIVHPLPSLVEEPVRQEKPTVLAQAPTPIKQPEEKAVSEVVVKKGDSLEKLAKRYQTSVSELIKLNQLPSSFLRIGQRLKIPSKTVVSVSEQTRANPNSSVEYYIVKVGDNPWSIALKHRMKVDELLKLNQLNEEKARKIKPGDRLRVIQKK